MTTRLYQVTETVIVPAGQQKTITPASDYIRFTTLPTGVNVSINGGVARAVRQASTIQGELGQRQVGVVLFDNTTGSDATCEVVHGTGSYSVDGEVALVGSIPLPAGAATAARQDTGNTSLASVDGKLPALSGGKVPVTDPTTLPLPTGAATAARQDTGNTSLATLAASGTETARGTVVNNATVAFNAKKSVAVQNRITSTGNVTVTFSDSSTLVLVPGEGASWSVTDRLNTLSNLSVTSPDATTDALVTSAA